jgi:hypothetical protein
MLWLENRLLFPHPSLMPWQLKFSGLIGSMFC